MNDPENRLQECTYNTSWRVDESAGSGTEDDENWEGGANDDDDEDVEDEDEDKDVAKDDNHDNVDTSKGCQQSVQR